jgi:hypothetical protein
MESIVFIVIILSSVFLIWYSRRGDKAIEVRINGFFEQLKKVEEINNKIDKLEKMRSVEMSDLQEPEMMRLGIKPPTRSKMNQDVLILENKLDKLYEDMENNRLKFSTAECDRLESELIGKIVELFGKETTHKLYLEQLDETKDTQREKTRVSHDEK